MLNWSRRFNIFSFLDSHAYAEPHVTRPWILAAGARAQFVADRADWQGLFQFHQQAQDWIFGHLAFELYADIFDLPMLGKDPVGFDKLHFFIPEYIFKMEGDSIQIGIHGTKTEAAVLWKQIQETSEIVMHEILPVPPFQATWEKQAYIDIINQLKAHIHRGDCYEINFCQSFHTQVLNLDTIGLYQALSSISPNPFSACYQVGHASLCCASPERYLQKQGTRLRSSPIKGTVPRNLADSFLDQQLRIDLQQNAKERAENIMVVDLVRNDLSVVCEAGSVEVTELCGVYAFPQVHQMISTIEGTLRGDQQWTDAIAASFPMGSMTGAPKKRVLELIRHYEKEPRGLFSGAVGYVDPTGDFDFNVVIRSLLYNRDSGHLRYFVGSGITYYCDAATEYEECNWKAAAIRKIWQT
jgi:para-aminobenzoate synthetase component 1